ncbi:MAG TPA: hypothetical protein VK735_22715, partial [Pseudonocardia sp.]|uniref:hypothetical protein n=1 Tax=Pseudonocardia sp. TaxID=60912 RepID=UPI002D03176C
KRIPSAWWLSAVVVEQGTLVATEWLLVLGGLLRGFAGSSGDLHISRALIHGRVGRGDRCQSNGCRGGGEDQWRDDSHFHHFLPPYWVTSITCDVD